VPGRGGTGCRAVHWHREKETLRVQVLVTGCAGFIGSHLTEALLGDGHAVLGIDCFNNNYGRAQKLRNLHHAQEWESFEFVPIDLSGGDLYELVADSEVVFHLAAEPGVRPSWGPRFEKYLQNNVLATQHLLEAAKGTGSRVVYASPSSIYGEQGEGPAPETALPAPYSPYGVTKLSGEHLCRLYHANHGVPAVILRYFSVYGPRQRPDMAFHAFCRRIFADEPITVFGDGEQARDFTFVHDVVRATLTAGFSGAHVVGETYNIGGGSQATVNQTLELLSELCGRRARVHNEPRQDGDVRTTSADISRAEEALGFAPRTALGDGLRAEVEWFIESLSPAAGAPS